MAATTVPVALNAGEYVVAQTIGAVGRKTGGQLMVTNQRVVFQPWDLKLAGDLIKYGGKALGVPHGGVVNYIVGRLVTYQASLAQGVGGIVGAHAVGMASLMAAPRIQIEKDDGTVAQFGVLQSVGTPNISPKNNVARDAFLRSVQQIFL